MGATSLFIAALIAQAPAALAQDGGKELIVGLEADPVCLDGRQIGYLWSLDIYRQVVDSLTEQDPVTGEFLPWLAESWEVNDTATEFVFHLRPDVTFSDGEPLNAAAVIANIEDALEFPITSIYLAGLDTFEAVDDYTVKFSFNQPNAQFLFSTSSLQLGLLSPRTLAEVSAADRCLGNLSGTGPYVIDSFVAQQRVELSSRDDYAWPTPVSDNPGAALIDKIVYEIIPEAGVRNGALFAGAIHIDHLVQEQDQQPLRDAGFGLLGVPGRGLAHSLLPNHQNAVWSSQNLRKAVSLAVDQAALSAFLPESSRPATSVLTSATPTYRDFSDLLQPDLDQAQALLDAEGWVLGADGIREKDGQKLTLRVLLRPNPIRQSVLEVLQQQLQAVGVQLVIGVQDHATATEAENSANFDFTFWNLTRNDASALLQWLDPTRDAPLHIKNPDDPIHALANSLRSAVAKEDQQKISEEIITRLINEAYLIPVFENSINFGYAPSVVNLGLDANNRPIFQRADLSE